jgi:hypothetical protein
MASSIDYDKLAAAMAVALAQALQGGGAGLGGVRTTDELGETPIKTVSRAVGVAETVKQVGGGAYKGGGTEGSKQQARSGHDTGDDGDVVLVEPEFVAGCESGPTRKDTSTYSWSEVVEAAVAEDKKHGKTSETVQTRARKVSPSSSAGSVRGRAGSPGTSVVDEDVAQGDFVSLHVRVPAVRQLAAVLGTVCGHKVPNTAMGDLALARYTSATVPAAFLNGRGRLKALAMVGDSALATVMLVACYKRGGSAEALHLERGTQRDAAMSRAFAGSELAGHVLVGGGVELGTTKTGATALEAFAGVLFMYCGPDAVKRYWASFGL